MRGRAPMAFAADGRSALPPVPERRAELYVTAALSGGASWLSRPLGRRAGRQRDVRLPDAPDRPVQLRRGALAPAVGISASPLNRTNSVPSRTSTTVPRHPSRGDGRVTRTREPMAIRPASVILSAVSGSLRTNFYRNSTDLRAFGASATTRGLSAPSAPKRRTSLSGCPRTSRTRYSSERLVSPFVVGFQPADPDGVLSVFPACPL